jgi:hypothetical protein
MAGFTLGLYAGKRRANGKGWGEIASEIVHSVCAMISGAWSRICAQFRKDDPAAVEAEVVQPAQ